MNTLAARVPKNPLICLRHIINTQKCIVSPVLFSTATIDVEAIAIELMQRHKKRTNPLNSSFRNFVAQDTNLPKSVADMTVEEIENELTHLLTKKKDKSLLELINKCMELNKKISEIGLKKIFRYYSISGKPDVVEGLQKYCAKIEYNLYKRNGEFMHYLAKAQCMRGNSNKGLSILTECYDKNEGLRNFYRLIFRELIQDSVLNRSEASLVIFKKYVLRFSDQYGDNYPLVCFWHICWCSSWFSDQMLANELLDTSSALQDIVKDKALAFSISILRQQNNEDAVFRLLQVLLKYHMMEEYVKVLQVLFGYKLKNRDVRGCTEIIRNCEALGVNLPSQQQGRYIRMLIDGKSERQSTENFKFKF